MNSREKVTAAAKYILDDRTSVNCIEAGIHIGITFAQSWAAVIIAAANGDISARTDDEISEWYCNNYSRLLAARGNKELLAKFVLDLEEPLEQMTDMMSLEDIKNFTTKLSEAAKKLKAI